jgi:16S rRNA A1518/A1519 N6-dimethyltransferase RsmA/KsgA/DIM1 with predicted DNA glycosylase/AP lyase activity
MVIQLIKNKKNNVINENIFYKLIEDAFKQKRKNLKNNLKNYDLERINNILKSFNKDLTFRAEQITIEEFIKISNNLS